jgi:hypothetical protein
VVANKCLIGAGDDAQLMAGCNIAIFGQPGLYKQMNTLLEEGLDESYHRDPLWGSVKQHLMIAPAVLYGYSCDPASRPPGKVKKTTQGKATQGKATQGRVTQGKATKAPRATKGKAVKAKTTTRGKAAKAALKATKGARRAKPARRG